MLGTDYFSEFGNGWEGNGGVWAIFFFLTADCFNGLDKGWAGNGNVCGHFVLRTDCVIVIG